jgi:hypothetical protein
VTGQSEVLLSLLISLRIQGQHSGMVDMEAEINNVFRKGANSCCLGDKKKSTKGTFFKVRKMNHKNHGN